MQVLVGNIISISRPPCIAQQFSSINRISRLKHLTRAWINGNRCTCLKVTITNYHILTVIPTFYIYTISGTIFISSIPIWIVLSLLIWLIYSIVTIRYHTINHSVHRSTFLRKEIQPIVEPFTPHFAHTRKSRLASRTIQERQWTYCLMDCRPLWLC